MSKLVNFLFRNSRLLFFIWLILILIVSSIPQLPTPSINSSNGSSFRLDYYIHFLIFFILSILFILWMVNKNHKQKFCHWILFFFMGIAFSFLIEIYQYIIPGRRFNMVDCFYNIMGILTGIVLIGLIYKTTNCFPIDIKNEINE
jgi:VanZ family protein